MVFKRFALCILSFNLACSTYICGEVITVNTPSQLSSDPKELYIDLMKRAILNTIYEDGRYFIDGQTTKIHDAVARDHGTDFPFVAHSMVGKHRLNNIQLCVERIISDQIPGDLIETGVWRGGSCILMRAILKAYNEKTRKVWVADSFSGLPAPDVKNYPIDAALDISKVEFLAVPLEQVQSNFAKYGLLDDQVVFLKGYFSETLPTAPIEKIALLRLDGDLYESTMDALKSLYHKVSVGGYVIVDDYGAIYMCAQAVNDFRQANGITDPLIQIDWTGVYWQKTK